MFQDHRGGGWELRGPRREYTGCRLHSGDLDLRGGYFEGEEVVRVVEALTFIFEGALVVVTPEALVAYGDLVAPGSYAVGEERHRRWFELEQILWRRGHLLRSAKRTPDQEVNLGYLEAELADRWGWGPTEVALAQLLNRKQLAADLIESAVNAVAGNNALGERTQVEAAADQEEESGG